MTWKQPIPTSITNLDTVTELVLSYILLRLRNEDMVAPKEFWHGNQRHLYQLKKGECVFAVERFCRESTISKSRVKKSLEILKNGYTDGNLTISLQITRQSFGLIVKLINADEVFSLDNHFSNQSTISQQSLENQSAITVTASNKNVNNDKPVKSVEVNLEAQEILNFYNETFSKNFKTAVGWKKNFEFWLTHYTLDEIKTAIRNLNHPNWWANKPKNGEPAELAKLDFLFRRSNSKGDCDYIGELLNLGEVENKQEPENVYRMSRSKFATEEELQRELAYYAEYLPQWKVILID
jgi:hypothetical protein